MHSNWLGSAFCLASATPSLCSAYSLAPPSLTQAPAQPTALYFLLNACTVMPVYVFPYVLGSRE